MSYNNTPSTESSEGYFVMSLGTPEQMKRWNALRGADALQLASSRTAQHAAWRRDNATRTSRFLSTFEQGEVGINMDGLALYDVLNEGKYYNKFELLCLESSESTDDQRRNDAVNQYFYPQLNRPTRARRLAFELAFGLGPDARYAALNFGGPGLTSYGVWCVKFTLPTGWESTTCFCGDSGDAPLVDENLDAIGNLERLRARHGTGDHRATVAAACESHTSMINSSSPDLARNIRNEFESKSHPLEIHVFSELTAREIKDVLLPSSWHRRHITGFEHTHAAIARRLRTRPRQMPSDPLGAETYAAYIKIQRRLRVLNLQIGLVDWAGNGVVRL